MEELGEGYHWEVRTRHKARTNLLDIKAFRLESRQSLAVLARAK